jgi:hypothetical protein
LRLTKTIEVTVLPDGTTKAETKGFAGGACREASRALEAALGVRQSEQLTVEFYSQATHGQRIQQER